MNFRRLGLSALALSLTIATGCTPNLATPPVTASGASAAAAQAGPAGIPLTGPANGPVSDVPVPPASGVVTPPTGATQASEGLAGTISGIPNVAGLEVAVYDQAGQELAPRVRTDEQGNYAFERIAATGGWVLVKAFIPSDRALMALDAGGRSLTAIVPAPGKGARAQARLDAASTLVAKKFVALVNRGQLKATDVDPAVVETAAAALRPVLKADDVERALRGDAQVAAVLFDLLLSRNPKVREAIAAANGAATLPRSTRGSGGSGQGTTTPTVASGVYRVAGRGTQITLGADTGSLNALATRGAYTFIAGDDTVLRVHNATGAQVFLQPPGIASIRAMAFDETGALWVAGVSSGTSIAKYRPTADDGVVGDGDTPSAIRTGGDPVYGLAFGDDGALYVANETLLGRLPAASTVHTADEYSANAQQITGLPRDDGSAGAIGGSHHFLAFVPDPTDPDGKRDLFLGVAGYLFRLDADADGKVDENSLRTVVAGNQSATPAVEPNTMAELPLDSSCFLLPGNDGELYLAVSRHQVVYRIAPGPNGLDVGDAPIPYAGTFYDDGYRGDGGSPTAAELFRPVGLALRDVSLLIAHRSYGPEAAVREVGADGTTISTAIGVPAEGTATEMALFGDLVQGMAAASGKVYWTQQLASNEQILYALDTATGVQKKIAQYETTDERPIAVSPSGALVVATDDALCTVNPDTGVLTTLVNGDFEGGIAFDAEGDMYYASDTTIYKAAVTGTNPLTIGTTWTVGEGGDVIRSLAISPTTGEIWAADASYGALIRLLPGEVPASGDGALDLGTKFAIEDLGYLSGLDFDAAGTLYFTTESSAFPTALVDFVTTDKSAAHVVFTAKPVGDGTYTVAHFAGSGVEETPVETVTGRATAALGAIRAFKVDRSTGALYAVDQDDDRLLRIK